MSDSDHPTPLRRIADWSVRLGLPLAVLATVMAVFFGEQLGIDHELLLISPPSGRPGETLPLRVVVLSNLGRPAGPVLAVASVEVSLRDRQGELLAEATLAPSPAGGAEGSLVVPDDPPARGVLRAVARVEGRGVASVMRSFDFTRPSPTAELGGRYAHAMQHFELGEIEAVGEETPPSLMSVRVVGGACVPDATCEILVWVGAPPAAVRFAPSAAVTIDSEDEEEHSGLARIALTLHGPEAHLMLEARRGGVLVAQRSMQLPVALATPGLTIEERVGSELADLRVSVLGNPPGLIIDAYQLGAWRRTGSVVPSEGPFRAPLTALGAGVWRLQVHTDRFASERSASRMVFIGSDVERAIGDVQELSSEGRGADRPTGPPALRFAWHAAALETDHRQLPPVVRGLEHDLEALEFRRRTLRIAALVAMLLGLVVLGVIFIRRGIDAALEAARVMEATGDPELASARHRRQTLLSALAVVAMGLLAFIGAAAMIVARARLLE